MGKHWHKTESGKEKSIVAIVHDCIRRLECLENSIYWLFLYF